MVEVGQEVQEFSLPASGAKTISLSSLRGQNLVLYFYPKDSTPGCTKEGGAFRDLYSEFKAANCEILGVSRDSVRAHDNFIAKQNFPFDLLSDKEETLCELFDVIQEKNMYGRKYMGIERSTFVIDVEGKLRKEWRKVRIPGHVEAVLDFVKGL